MITINGKNGLILKPVRLDSAGLIFNAIDNSREHLRTWLPFVDQTKSVGHTKNFIKSVLNSQCLKKDVVFEIWAEKQFSGLIALKEVDLYNQKTEIGYWLIAEMTGKGIMIAACELLIQHAFSKLNMNRIMIKVAQGNIRSIAIPKKLGFTFEGIERNGEFLHDRFVNLEIYSLLKSEYLK